MQACMYVCVLCMYNACMLRFMEKLVCMYVCMYICTVYVCYVE